jgi:hypothetical protein
MKRLFTALLLALCLTAVGAGTATASDDPGMTHNSTDPSMTYNGADPGMTHDGIIAVCRC